ncbi:MAG: RagB/SusD family nutrient uptake outer membrane protein [Ferruginibacter sp.]
MLNYKNKTAVIFLLFLVTAISCKKSFLTEEPRGVTIQDLINDPQNGSQRLIGAVYSKMYDWNVHSFSWNGVSSITSDDAEKGSDAGDPGVDKGLLDNWAFDATSLSFDEIWIGNFEGIGRACYALKFLPEMNIDATLKNRYIGEAKLLRAYFYWNLVRAFGDLPKIDHVLESQADIQAASIRSPASEIYALMEADLSDAITMLPPSVPSAEKGRATVDAARALLAKVSLYNKNWSRAKAMSDAIVSTGRYSLLPDYSMIWKEAGEFSAESIWEVNGVGSTPNRGIEGYFVTQAPRGPGGLGWGFNIPSADLFGAYEPGDKRRDATIMQRGQTLWDGFQVSPLAPNPYYNYKSYVSKTQETFNGEDWQSNKNLRLFRFGEILLIKAEAENELNDTTAAKLSLNALRSRAGLPAISAISKDIMRGRIYKERRVEMAFEHDRMFDLRRTGRSAAVLIAHGKPYMSPKHDLFPIPQRQRDLSALRLSQNPGY